MPPVWTGPVERTAPQFDLEVYRVEQLARNRRKLAGTRRDSSLTSAARSVIESDRTAMCVTPNSPERPMHSTQVVDNDDRRFERRLPIRITVEYEDTEDFLTDYTANLSIGGMFIETDEPLAMGVRFRLRFSVPDRKHPIDTVAVVRWSQPASKASPMAPGMGVRFEELSRDDMAAVQAMLSTWM